jgi:C4-dicarboxylate-specific signal transduction histidine kinase
MRDEPDAPIRDHAEGVDVIIEATHRMARIVDNIRTFARQSRFDRELIPAPAPVEDALLLISEQLRLKGIQLEREVEPDLPPILGDRVRLQQVFLNIFANARDVLDTVPRDREKCIRVRIRLEGGTMVFAIDDSGPGVAMELETRIFDPFFTTKPPGQGTGLGLSLSFGIIQEHGGEIAHARGPRGGACFTVRLPIAPALFVDAAEGDLEAGVIRSRDRQLATPWREWKGRRPEGGG